MVNVWRLGYEMLRSVSYTTKLRNSKISNDGPPEIESWIAKKCLKKIKERLNRSAETADSTLRR